MHISNTVELQAAIAELKQDSVDMEIKIKEQVKDFVKGAEDAILNVSVAAGTGLLAKKILPLKKDTFLKSLVSYGVQGAVTTAAINNADKIKAFATAVWKNIFKK